MVEWLFGWCSMSPKPGGFNPSRLTFDEVKQYADLFKDLLKENPVVKWSIIMAGVGGLCEILHTLWLAARFAFGF
jgi:hypothetical protein